MLAATSLGGFIDIHSQDGGHELIHGLGGHDFGGGHQLLAMHDFQVAHEMSGGESERHGHEDYHVRNKSISVLAFKIRHNKKSSSS